MKFLIFSIFFISFNSIFAINKVKCQIYQKSLKESDISTNNTEVEMTENQSKSTYLKTVISQLETKVEGDKVFVALKNNVGSQNAIIDLKKNSQASKSFDFSSHNPNVISNHVRIECK